MLQELSTNVSTNETAGDEIPSFFYIPNGFVLCTTIAITGSKFGGVLDMVTDRVSTCGLLVILAQFYPPYSFWFTFLIVLDITSHWFHVMRYTHTICLLAIPCYVYSSIKACSTNVVDALLCEKLKCFGPPQVQGGTGSPQRATAVVLLHLPAVRVLLRGHGVLLHSALRAPLLPQPHRLPGACLVCVFVLPLL